MAGETMLWVETGTRELFGKWALLVENVGLISILIFMGWLLLVPKDVFPAGLLFLTGVDRDLEDRQKEPVKQIDTL